MQYEVQIPIVDNVSIVVTADSPLEAILAAYLELDRRLNAPGFPDWLSPTTDDHGINVYRVLEA